MCVACSSLWLNMLAVLVILFLWASLGMVAFAYYFYCDPLLGKRIQRYDQVSSPLLSSPVCSANPLAFIIRVQYTVYRHRSSYFIFVCCR